MARSYEASILDFSGGMSPQTAPERAPGNESYQILNLYYRDERLQPRRGLEAFALDTSLRIYAAAEGVFEYVPQTSPAVEHQKRTVLLAHDGTDLGVYLVDLDTPSSAVTELAPSPLCSRYITTHWQNYDAPDGANIVFFNGSAFIFSGREGIGSDRLRPLVVTYGGGSSYTLELLDTWADPDAQEINVYSNAADTMTELAEGVLGHDFVVAAGETSVGYYIASDYPVSRVKAVASGVNDAGLEEVRISYYDGNSFAVVEATPGFSGAKVDSLPAPAAGESEYLLWPNPMYVNPDHHWHYGAGDLDSTALIAKTKYVLYVEVIASAAPASDQTYTLSFYFDPLQYATQNEPLQGVFTHNQRLWAIGGNALNQSSYNDARRWNAADTEIFEDGGPRLNAHASFRDALFVFKDRQVYELTGTSYVNYQKRTAFDIGGEHALATSDGIWFSSGRNLYFTTGRVYVRVNSHVTSAADGPITGLFLIDGWVFVQHENASYLFDPDGITENSSTEGEGRVSMFEVDGPHPFISAINDDFMVADTGLAGNLERFIDEGTDYGAGFVTRWASHFASPGSPGTPTQIERLKLELAPAGDYTLTLYPDRGRLPSGGVESYATVLSTGTTASVAGYEASTLRELTLPYQLDGRTIRIQLDHNGVPAASQVRLFGVYLAFRRRKF